MIDATSKQGGLNEPYVCHLYFFDGHMFCRPTARVLASLGADLTFAAAAAHRHLHPLFLPGCKKKPV